MYKADYVLEVRDSSLTKLYTEGKDYKVVDGKLVILPSGSIPITSYEEYFPKDDSTGAAFPYINGEYIFFAEGAIIHKKQIYVTYAHLDEWTGSVPESKISKLPKTSAKLTGKEPVNVVLYGDSISVGCNASEFTGTKPFASCWYNMAVQKLKDYYGYDNITLTNTSVGGQGSDWGVSNAKSLAADKKPDLAIIGFGMNDGGLTPEKYKENIVSIIDTIKSTNPNCEFILVATMLPNKEVVGFYGNQIDFLPKLKELEKTGVAVADITTMHSYLLTKKNYYDMTGNNVNHPNDFLSRLYAQVISKTLGAE